MSAGADLLSSANPSPSARSLSLRVWCGLALFLLAWNGTLVAYSGPEHLVQGYDGAQYQLLARNRLLGRYEVGGQSHTVRKEGSHPMWRPGLVWLIEGLAPWIGSVRLAAGLISALGTTLLELAMLWLAWRCFGRVVCLVLFLILLSPMTVSAHFLRLAVGQGPEPWATAALLAGFAILVEIHGSKGWPPGSKEPFPSSAAPFSPSKLFALALLAGACAGLANWFRTGNSLIFASFCAVYGLASWWRRDRRGLALTVVTFLGFWAVGGTVDFLYPSSVDKPAANFWGNLVEHRGPQLVVEVPDYGPVAYFLGGLQLAPGGEEVYYDHLVRRSGEINAKRFLSDNWEEALKLYAGNLAQAVAGGFLGPRMYLGGLLICCFLFQLLSSLVRSDEQALPTAALAAGALAFYFGPLVFLRGNQPTHYCLVIVPLFLLVGAAGLVQGLAIAWAAAKRAWPTLNQSSLPRLLFALALAPLLCLSASYYLGALATMQESQQRERAEQADLDALGLDGHKIACRNMAWFVDRDVETVLLPYATIAELENYARYQRLDGILLWANEKQKLFVQFPYGSVAEFESALGQSALFGPPRVCGAWRFYQRVND
jgi:hypothetical protein